MTNEQIVSYVRTEILPKLYVAEQGEEMTNPHSGQSCFLEPEAVALYEWIKGTDVALQGGFLPAAQEEIQIKKRYVICDYFRLMWPSEYSKLID